MNQTDNNIWPRDRNLFLSTLNNWGIFVDGFIFSVKHLVNRHIIIIFFANPFLEVKKHW